jgi:cell wall-associated NlpC family hydrolase
VLAHNARMEHRGTPSAGAGPQPAGRAAAPIVERAIAWALEHIGSPAYSLRCLAFVEDAYERPNQIEVFGGSSAAESAAIYGATESSGEPPRGAFVFFDTSGPVDGAVQHWGHVGLALGDGSMVHAWSTVRVDAIHDVNRLSGAPGWSAPIYVGWTSPERILEGAIGLPSGEGARRR